MRGTPWSNEEIKLVKKLFDEGLSDKDISNQLPHRHFRAIKTLRYRYGFTHKTKSGTKWSDEEINLLMKLYNEGFTDKEIAKKLPNRNEYAVAQFRSKKGFKRSRIYETENIIERFWSSIDIKTPEECWEHPQKHYYRFWIPSNPPTYKGQYIQGHQFSWIITNKQDIPEDMVIMHKCDNPKCVNPNHLELGTTQDNMQDMVRKNRHVKPKEHFKHIKLTKKVVNHIRKELSEKKLTGREIAKKYNTSPATVSGIKNKKLYKWVEEEK